MRRFTEFLAILCTLLVVVISSVTSYQSQSLANFKRGLTETEIQQVVECRGQQ